jgi:hypothetical protein
MATVPPTPVDRPGPARPDAWSKLGSHAAHAFGHVWRFFTTYPPLAQGLYYLLIGLWPLVDIGGYRETTGHAQSPWMAQAVGVLLLVIGSTLCLAAYRRQGSPEVLFLAFGSALGLAGVDAHLVWRGYSAYYLLDAALQLGLVAFWIYGWRKAARAAATLAAPPAQPPARGGAR